MAYVFKTSLLAVLLLVPVSFTSVQAADEFGPRFTNMAPAALGGSESDALVAAQDIEDFSAEDLNAIAPAAGGVSDDNFMAGDDINKKENDISIIENETNSPPAE